jgi:hypothetical protein
MGDSSYTERPRAAPAPRAAMSKTYLLATLCLFGCSEEQPRQPLPKAPAINSATELEERFARLCPLRDRDVTLNDHIASSGGVRFRCSFGTKIGETGPVEITLGVEGALPTERVCTLHIGPDTVRAPFPLESIPQVFEDSMVGAAFAREIAPIDQTHAYDIRGRLHGFWFHITQHVSQYEGEGEPVEGPRFEVEIDGCEELTRSMQVDEVHPRTGEPITFRHAAHRGE